jgi:hypothetical protein
MALSEDQKAMLRLLAQRGEQGYADLAALMGSEVGEVHAKALEAAAQLESEGIPPPAIPPLPGARATEGPPPANPDAVEASPPEPAAQPEPQPESSAAAPSRPRRPMPTLPKGDGARAALAAGGLVVVALIVILVIGGGGDSADSGTTGSNGGGSAAEEAVNASGSGGAKEVTQAILDPLDGSAAKGVATFGRVKNSLALQLEATGLEPTAKGESYTVWLYESAQKMLPLASTRVGKSGEIGVQVEVPTEVLGYLANETFDQIDISLTEDAVLKASLAKATSEKKAPVYTGADVLRGRITGPIIGAARK